MPSAPTSPLVATSGGVCGPYMGWWNGHAHYPENCIAEFPTQMYIEPLFRSDPCELHRLMQKPSTATSWAVNTTATPPFLGPALAASSDICDILSDLPKEHSSSETWPASKMLVFVFFPALAK
ncbi:hypothetical protein Cni_G00868 [Canna indica]|uniref:Uncharacterized protein n=1 Tax=Canna indica TaxID=4628 RepID=A0AAQ3JNF6_9LILI|nr:hypothetical protein Cni_G00868 [Canna indica]